MSKTKVYIDGQSGTTGLQIFDRIGARDDLELMQIDEDKRHDNEERRKFLNAADIVFLCLPDAGAREAVSRRTALPTAGPTVSRSSVLSSARRSRQVTELPTRAATRPALSPARHP